MTFLSYREVAENRVSFLNSVRSLMIRSMIPSLVLIPPLKTWA